MARPRIPIEKARLTGADRRNSSRFAGRSESKAEPIGDPPSWMTEPQRAAWNLFCGELPWLAESDRSLVEIAATVRARLLAGEDVGLGALTLLRQCLGAMGATPADRTKVQRKDENPFGLGLFN